MDGELAVGEVLEMPVLETGLVGYVQITRVLSQREHAVRVLPGRYAERLGDQALRELVMGPSRCTFFARWPWNGGPQRAGILPVPAGRVGRTPTSSSAHTDLSGRPMSWLYLQ